MYSEYFNFCACNLIENATSKECGVSDWLNSEDKGDLSCLNTSRHQSILFDFHFLTS